MKPCIDRLVQLSIHAFPGYQSIIAEYTRAIGELHQGASPLDVQEIIGPLRELREAYVTTSTRGRDYLDWYEITHLGKSPSQGSFASYLEAMRILRKEQPGPNTHMSRYLEDVESLYCLEEGSPLPERIRKQIKKRKPKTEQVEE